MANSATAVQGPLFFGVQHFCLHDGPGIRSLVFFKGCPLRCQWCQNPESWEPTAELGFKAHLCVRCGTCAAACPEGAVSPPGRDRSLPGRDPSRCRRCFRCADRCPAGALVRFGVARDVSSLVAELRPEFSLYRASGGGVTLSGGEPTLRAGVAADLAEALKGEGIPVALETCGLFSPGSAEAGGGEACGGGMSRLLRSLDLILFDVKVFDSEEHRRLCGAGNAVIKENLGALAAAWRRGQGPVVWARLPFVGGATSDSRNIAAWAGFLRECGLTRLTLVPYHSLGDSKRAWLGLGPGLSFRPPTEAEAQEAVAILERAGITVFAPGEEGLAARVPDMA